MRKQEKLSILCGAVGMLLLILDGKTALVGAQEGLALCLRTVIPALFPFFVLSSLLAGSLRGKFFRPLGKLFHYPAGMESLLVPGILGGYPAGAQAIAQCRQMGRISKPQAERMLAFCNNAGPSFLFGMIGPQFSSPFVPWLLWGIHLVGAFCASGMFSDHTEIVSKPIPVSAISLPQALNKGLTTTAIVCGWVILFRILITFLNRWILWLFPTWMQIFVTGLLELSNGCCNLMLVENEGLRFLLCAAMLGCGGLCVTMQTASVTDGLSLRYYGLGKLMQTGVGVLLSYVVQLFFPERIVIPGFAIGICCLIFLLFAGNRKFNSRNTHPVRV